MCGPWAAVHLKIPCKCCHNIVKRCDFSAPMTAGKLLSKEREREEERNADHPVDQHCSGKMISM